MTSASTSSTTSSTRVGRWLAVRRGDGAAAGGLAGVAWTAVTGTGAAAPPRRPVAAIWKGSSVRRDSIRGGGGDFVAFHTSGSGGGPSCVRRFWAAPPAEIGPRRGRAHRRSRRSAWCQQGCRSSSGSTAWPGTSGRDPNPRGPIIGGRSPGTRETARLLRRTEAAVRAAPAPRLGGHQAGHHPGERPRVPSGPLDVDLVDGVVVIEVPRGGGAPRQERCSAVHAEGAIRTRAGRLHHRATGLGRGQVDRGGEQAGGGWRGVVHRAEHRREQGQLVTDHHGAALGVAGEGEPLLAGIPPPLCGAQPVHRQHHLGALSDLGVVPKEGPGPVGTGEVAPDEQADHRVGPVLAGHLGPRLELRHDVRPRRARPPPRRRTGPSTCTANSSTSSEVPGRIAHPSVTVSGACWACTSSSIVCSSWAFRRISSACPRATITTGRVLVHAVVGAHGQRVLRLVVPQQQHEPRRAAIDGVLHDVIGDRLPRHDALVEPPREVAPHARHPRAGVVHELSVGVRPAVQEGVVRIGHVLDVREARRPARDRSGPWPPGPPPCPRRRTGPCPPPGLSRCRARVPRAPRSHPTRSPGSSAVQPGTSRVRVCVVSPVGLGVGERHLHGMCRAGRAREPRAPLHQLVHQGLGCALRWVARPMGSARAGRRRRCERGP